MRVFDETEELDCKRCGACCVGSSADGDFVPVTALDRRRMPTKYVKKLQDVEPAEDGPFGLGLKRFGDQEACVALKGSLGKDVGCDFYAQRPEHCRTFERGSAACLEQRASLFYIRPAFAEAV